MAVDARANTTDSDGNIALRVVTSDQGGVASDLGQATMAESSPVVIASDQSRIPVTLQDAGGTEVDLAPPDTGTVTSVNDTASSTTLLAANADRKGFVIVNESTSILYAKFGATASTSSYTIVLQGTGGLPVPALYQDNTGYTGIVDGIWSADASGAARITELE